MVELSVGLIYAITEKKERSRKWKDKSPSLAASRI